jgi:acetolactate synthase small subunit
MCSKIWCGCGGRARHQADSAALGKWWSAIDGWRARNATTESFIFELIGAPRKIDDFVELMRPIGLVEVLRIGVAANLARAGADLAASGDSIRQNRWR